jgi:tetratricopeptide (TPR) repeat protein
MAGGQATVSSVPVRRGIFSKALFLSVAFLLAEFPAPFARAESFGELVNRGNEMLQNRRFEEAAASFDSALEIEPASEPVRKGLASAYFELGVSHVRAGRIQQGRDFLEKAVKAQPEIAEYHLLLAEVIFKGADTRDARREINRALELAPDSAAARELSGDIYDREGQLNLAVGEWETAAKAGGSYALAGKIARGQREMTAEAGMERESSRYFIIIYEREVPRELVRGFFKMLDQAFDSLHDRLGEYPRSEITVILYAKSDFKSVTQAPDWSGGLYDGKIRIPVGGLTTVEEAAGLQAVLVHEMTHAFLYRMAPAGLPLWFNEGLATAIQGWDTGKVRAYFSEHPPEGLASLADVDRALQGRGGDVTAGYMAARLAIGDLEEMRGFGAIRRIIAGVGAGGAFAAVFRDEARVDVAEFEDRWRRGLR